MQGVTAIRVANISKVYRIYSRPEHRLLQMASLGRIRRFTEFSALRDVSLDVGRGETVGIVGRNGCGKSTLLQIICGTLQPTSGSVEINGRVAALLELGAGFNPEFTGRENVYMNAAILGLDRAEIDERFARIAEFASIGDFIERPVKTYSSGMFVRLAFAVATAVEPDILIVDEALSVGDEAFQRKCFARIEGIKERGGTILFVSHGAQTIVQLCDRAVLLDAGEMLVQGEPKFIIQQYQRLINLPAADVSQAREEIKRKAQDQEFLVGSEMSAQCAATASELANQHVVIDPGWYDSGLVSQSSVEYPSRGATIHEMQIVNRTGSVVNVLARRQRYTLRYKISFQREFDDVRFGFHIHTVSGLSVCGTGTGPEMCRQSLTHAEGGTVWVAEFDWDCMLAPGMYFFTAGVGTKTLSGESIYLHRLVDALPFRVDHGENLNFSGLFDLSVDARFAPWGDSNASPNES